jgi:hypothetical protein
MTLQCIWYVNRMHSVDSLLSVRVQSEVCIFLSPNYAIGFGYIWYSRYECEYIGHYQSTVIHDLDEAQIELAQISYRSLQYRTSWVCVISLKGLDETDDCPYKIYPSIFLEPGLIKSRKYSVRRRFWCRAHLLTIIKLWWITPWL